jgi:alpha-amylase/alpha-mannosidase (GH57 family)
MVQPRYICVHGHFYQPPRENPWLEAVEVQDSASPFHDWNERITRECYGPNSRARLVDQSGKIIDLINNYAWMSYNFGPTLLAWLEQGAPEVLQGIVEGDRVSRERRHGHGNALAQVYNHIIMPLASPHDQRTQVLWGIADFRKRFGREPEGMWLAETAANIASLEKESLLNSIHAAADLPKATAYADKLLDAAQLLETPLDLWQTQNHLLSIYAKMGADKLNEPLKQAFAHLAERLNIGPNVLGWRP